ncbi:hypothetical protein FHS09_004505 [Microbulbifer rhizosphaerae]|uniref:Group II intron maturase-specific domain-containing protein n=1 Tax=Microbulbifer rhizosphaerae TaxID=1562603 RepID=A0A7W4ZBI6_9GAMM|nr:hypothetical protein [Microbulbifer rhizosphaerae]
MVKSKRAGVRVLASITRFVEQRLKLVVNDQKSQVAPVSRCKFLGFTFHGKQLRWHPKALAKFKREVRRLTGRSRGISMDARMEELTTYLRGWINYFGIASGYQRCDDLDNWIRRRIRMCFWKQWRLPRTKVRNLIRLGVSLDEAIPAAMSSKGYWRNSRSKIIHRALSNKHLEKLGLFSLRTRWVELHYGS